MSESTESDETGDGDGAQPSSVAEIFDEYYHLPVLATLLSFMLWVRVRTYESFFRDGDVLFRGNDAYYHYRQVEYTVRHWPTTMPYDVWTQFPQGTSQGQFGTLYDQFMATVALIVGLGDPSTKTVAMVALFTPAVIGAALAIPVYKLAARFGDRQEGLFAVFLLALLPGQILTRSLVGFTDHHIAEAFMMAVAVLGFVIALEVTEREKPVYEQALDRDWRGMAEPLKWSALTGVALALYMWIWPPGVVLVGIGGVFFLIALTVDYLRGRSPDHVALVGIVSMTVAALLVLVNVDSLGFDTVSLSLLQVLLALGVAAGCAFMAGLARVWDDNEIDPRGYPAAIGGILVVGTVFLAVALPDLFNLIRGNLARTVLLDQSDNLRTVGEAQSLLSRGDASEALFREYGMLFFTTVLGLLWMAGKTLGDDYESRDLFLVVWTVFLTLMGFTQLRFNYYLAIAVVVVNAWLFGRVADLIELPSLGDKLGELTGYQVITVLAVFTVVFVPLATPLAATTAWEQSENNGPGRSAIWSENGDWMEENTPAPGRYGNPDGDPMKYYGTYGSNGGDYAYPDGAYGVLSWWDYGHWITVENERIPVANPFQQNARQASAFFQAQNESRAVLYLQALSNLDDTDQGLYEMNRSELERVVDERSAAERNETVRYIMIDDETAGRKFRPVTVWTGPGFSNYFTNRQYTLTNQRGEQVAQETLPTSNQQYAETMLSRLYFQDTSGMEHFRLVHEVERFSYVGGLLDDNGRVRPFATRLLSVTNWSRIQPFSRQLSQSRQLARLGQRRAIGIDLDGNGRPEYLYDGHIESTLKTFEYVPGATITGQTDTANATVQVSVGLEVTNTGRTFQYTTTTEVDENGEFSVTVPYATTDYLGVDEGATNSSVRALGPYTVRAFDTSGRPVAVEQDQVNVSEAAVLAEDSEPIEAEMELIGDPPEANVTTNRTVVAPGEPIEFNASNSTGRRLSYTWSGAISGTNQTVVRSFDEPGTYTVNLTVSDVVDRTDNATVTIEVVAEENESNASVAPPTTDGAGATAWRPSSPDAGPLVAAAPRR
jgi:oligosaccharyl transferase (archaeosortase A-associated)